MEHHSQKSIHPPYRHGLHYYNDTSHFTQDDLRSCLPKLKDLQAAWLVLQSHPSEFIPSFFLEQLIEAKIRPIILIKPSLEKAYDISIYANFFEGYANSGVKHIILFDRPNLRRMWVNNGWSQPDLVRQFLKIFLPLAESATEHGLAPIFPALEPGGDYWDTAFLRSALEQMQEQKKDMLLKNLILSAYAWSWNHGLNWGAGGPERWPNACPYHTPVDTQDQCGFRIFDWYQAIAKSVLNQPLPIILLEAGLPQGIHFTTTSRDKPLEGEENYQMIVRLLCGDIIPDSLNPEMTLEPIPEEVISCNFTMLEPAGNQVQEIQQTSKSFSSFLTNLKPIQSWIEKQKENEIEDTTPAMEEMEETPTHTIKHYLLLPNAAWAAASERMQALQPFITRYQPVIGYSSEEAGSAEVVTVIAGEQGYPEKVIEKLQKLNCTVRRIQIKPSSSSIHNKEVEDGS